MVLASVGAIPREAVLFWTGLAIFYMIFSPVKDSLWLILASIPLFVALPLGDSFDSMANWRILVAVLTLCLFFKEGISVHIRNWRIKESLKHYKVDYWAAGFALLGLLSLFFAQYQGLALRKLLFLINALLVFLVVRNVARTKEEVIRVWQALAAGGVMVLAVALLQFIASFFLTLYDFWQFWAHRVINVFYGQNLSELLSVSNTWFAYYQSAPPTLRLFSVFPDSHSFAMFCILAVPVFFMLVLFSQQQKWQRTFYWSLVGVALFGVIFSGSRGTWISVLPVMVAALFFWAKKLEPALIKKTIPAFLAFILFFILFSGYPPFYYKVQTWTTGQFSSSTFALFERAKSISDLDETSNKSRLQIWKASAESIAKKPFFGVGLGNYVTVLNEESSAAKKGASAHNLYLDFAAETGLIGLVLVLGVFADILYSGWLLLRSRAEEKFRFFGLLFGLYFLWVLGYSLFDVVMLNDKVLLFLAAETATLYALRNIILDPQKLLPKPLPFWTKNARQ